MDQITTAIIAAVTAQAAETGKTVVKDAYELLKSALMKKFGENKKLVRAIEGVEDDPADKPSQNLLETRITETEAAKDPELTALVKKLVEALGQSNAGKAALGKYNVNVTGGEVGIIGDNVVVHGGINFGGKAR